MAGFANLIWIVSKDYDMGRQEFIYMAEAAQSLGLVRPNDIQLRLSKYSPCTMKSITGCVVETRTLADFRKLASKPPDVIIVAEPGMIDNLKQVMELLWGRVSEKRGCIILAGTSDESSEEWYELWSRWSMENPEGGKSYSMPTWQNTIRYPRGKREQEFLTYEEMYGEEALMAHYGGIPASPRDLVLRNYWNEKVHLSEDVVWQPDRQTEIAIDPNYAPPNAYSVLCVQWDIGTGEVFLVDEIAESGMTHDAIIALTKEREWFPHVFGGTIDPWAESNIFGAPVPAAYWAPLPLRYDHRPRVETTLQAIKEVMALQPNGAPPQLKVNPRCNRFREEAKRWRLDKYGKPGKTWCDALKAFGYWLVDRNAHKRGLNADDDDNIAVGALTAEWRFE